MADLSHERARLHAGVDAFIDSFEKYDSDEYPDITIDTFGIVTICVWDDDEDQAEAPFCWFESRRHHVQIGILRASVLDQESSYHVASE